MESGVVDVLIDDVDLTTEIRGKVMEAKYLAAR